VGKGFNKFLGILILIFVIGGVAVQTLWNAF
jgi:hypothetical protein